MYSSSSIAVPQISGEAPDRKIRKRIKLIEHNSEMLLQLALVIGLQLVLRRWQKRADRIVNQMQRQRSDRFRSLTSSEVATPRCCLRIRLRRVARSRFPPSNTASTR